MSTVKALANYFTSLPEETHWAPIRTNFPCPARRTITTTRRCFALASILALALLLASITMRSSRTLVHAQRTGPSGRACTFTGHVMTLATVAATTHFGTMQTVPITRALFLASFAHITFGALTRTCVLVTYAVVDAFAFALAFSSPKSGWAD